MSSRTLAISGALLIGLIVPAGAGAATMEPLAKPCYVTAGTAANPQGEGVVIKASGFTPSSLVDLAIDGRPVPNATGLQTDATGAIGTLSPLTIPAPFVPRGSKDFTVTLTEQGNPANVATATAKSTALAVTVKPRVARPTSNVTFSGTGFTAKGAVYAHYVHGGKLRATVRMARGTGECGAWKAKAPQIAAKVRLGLWTVQFDQSKKFRKSGITFARLEIRVGQRAG